MEFAKFLALLAIVCVMVSFCDGGRKRKSARRTKRNHATCRARLMMRYKMTVTTTWTKSTFPKMFPTYRPHAHWSTLLGRTHGPTYQMWQVGRNASQAVQRFAEDEDSELLELETGQGYNNVLDIFTAPAVDQSAGETSAVLMVDGRHSKVSFMMKVVPSPDWFIGLSGLDLCHRGRWKKRVHLDLGPYDAGTDQGYTFTSPNWPNEPQEPVSAITSSTPNHPACSFFYPEYKKLPRLAYVDLELLSEHRLRRTFRDLKEVITTTTTTARPTTSASEYVNAFSTGSPGNGKNVLIVSDTTASMNDGQNVQKKPANFPKYRFGLIRSEDKIRNPGTQGASPRMGRNKSRPSNQQKPNEKLYIDCLVSEWSEWSQCSKTCGFGTRQRSREVTQMPAKRGNNCPLLREKETCGSMRTCKWSHFSMMNRQNTTRFSRAQRARVRGQRRRQKRRHRE